MSQNLLSWKRPIRVVSKSLSCAGHHKNPKPCVPESVVQTLPELRQAWCHYCCPQEPVPVLNHPLGEKPFSDI